MTKKGLTEAMKKLRKMFPDVYTSVEYKETYDTHPRSEPKFTEECLIYTAHIGHLRGTTFEECFAQL